PLVTVPVHAEQHFLVISGALWRPRLRFGTEEGDPDMRDHSGALLVQKHVSPTGINGEVIPVAGFVEIAPRFGLGFQYLLLAATPHFTHPHARRSPHRAALLRFGKVIQSAVGPGGRGYHDNDQQSKRRYRALPSGQPAPAPGIHWTTEHLPKSA